MYKWQYNIDWTSQLKNYKRSAVLPPIVSWAHKNVTATMLHISCKVIIPQFALNVSVTTCIFM